MKKEKIRYVGSFPPPYGGVTIKNELIKKYLSSEFDIIYPKSSSSIAGFLWILGSIFTRKKMIIGVSAAGKKSLLITKFLYFFNKRAMKKSLYFMMGGLESSRISSNKREIKMYSYYKRIYVEIDSMKILLEESGLHNVFLYPNCREIIPFKKHEHSGFKCVFFSFISKSKGADLAIEAAKMNPSVFFGFYGEIEEKYKNEFFNEINSITNAKYYGVYKANEKNVYDELNEYDVLLFPTRWKNEGIPGVLIEAKLAGVPVIASDIAFNRKIVVDNVDGLIIESNSVEKLSNAISLLLNDNSLLNNLKIGTQKTAKQYYIGNYIDEFVNVLKEEV